MEWFHIGRADKAVDDRVEHAVGLKDARKAAREVVAWVALGKSPHAERRASMGRARAVLTFEATSNRYVEQSAKQSRRAWQQGDAPRHRYSLPKLGKRPVAEIRRADIRAIFNDLTTAQGHPVLANQVPAATSSVFSWAVKQELIEHNPAKAIERNKPRSRERVLSEAELPAFWRAFDRLGDPVGDALKLILPTGQRPGEVSRVRGRDLELGEFTLQDNSGRAYKAQGGWWTLPGAPDGDWPGTKKERQHARRLAHRGCSGDHRLCEDRRERRGPGRLHFSRPARRAAETEPPINRHGRSMRAGARGQGRPGHTA